MQYYIDKELFILRRRTEYLTKLLAIHQRINYDAPFDHDLNDELRTLGEEYRDVAELSTILKELAEINRHYNAA